MYSDKISELHARVTRLRHRLEENPSKDSPDAHEQLREAIEELNVAEEELRQQGDELTFSQSQLEQERLRYRDLFQFAPDAYLVTDCSGMIHEANQAAGALFQIDPQSLPGKPLANFISTGDVRHFRTVISDLIRTGVVAHLELRLKPRSGGLMDASFTVALVKEPNEATGLRWMIRDVSVDKSMERRVRALNAELEQRVRERTLELENANRAKDQFLAMLSHELRTPLAPVLSAVSALHADESLSPEMRELVSMVQRNVELEARLIDDLLDLTRISRGRIELESGPRDLHLLLMSVIEICRSEANSKRIRIEQDFDATRHHVFADAARLHQVFWNLLKNAVKFTPDNGAITLRTRNSTDRTVQVEVRDTGVGMAAALLPRVFGAFEMARQPAGNGASGLGLGLTIARALVEAHGGTITAQSAGEGKGACFVVELRTVPEPRAAKGNAAPLTSDGKPHVRILLVEDHPDTLRVLVRLLKSSGFSVQGAASMREALQLASSEPFDLLISDLGLPDGSGNELMREVRSRQRVRSGIALSGFGMEADIRRSRDAGFSGHLTKPVSYQKLMGMIKEVTAQFETSSK